MKVYTLSFGIENNRYNLYDIFATVEKAEEKFAELTDNTGNVWVEKFEGIYSLNDYEYFKIEEVEVKE